ncbi:serine hydrolase domain-containing protein [Pseudoalteromonas fuliginea]|uniref:serine hydrolase domain-containing protein n=1 Tax=Pseudoalteromonas TaxID=53246 RepID=UPI0002AAD5D9|nr:serine hydrolase domain-containing protein [Pseudoalteromonas sp. Bsw20308]ALQ07368.1 oxidoreductase [Pseudoalteromonas sp. Bsw20308]
MKRYLVTLLFLITIICNQALAADKLNYNKLADEFISVLNSKDLKQVEDFIVKNFSPDALSRWDNTGKDRYVGYSMNVALFHGSLSLLSTELDTSNNRIQHISKVYSKNTDMQYEIVIDFNEEQAVTGWFVGENPKSLDMISLTESQLVNEVKNYSNLLAINGIFSGTILLAKGNKVLFTKAHGLASRRYDVKNNLDTKFQIGSMNKMFTSVAILQLVEAGKVLLDDPITKFIDKTLLGKGDFDKIQIHHLLSHTSGIGNIAGFDEIQHKVRSLEDIQHLYSSIETTFKPGSQWRYSNTGMLLLGQVIESVTKESYFKYIDKNIYQKANMQHSGSFDLDVPIKNTARNYWFSVETGEITENLMFQSVKGGPAGGGYSTVGDLYKFALAMQNGTLISRKLSQEALTSKPELGAENWGYGFSVRGADNNKIVGHNGAHLGMTARLNMYQDKGYILVVLGNFQSSAWPIVAKVDQLIERL